MLKLADTADDASEVVHDSLELLECRARNIV